MPDHKPDPGVEIVWSIYGDCKGCGAAEGKQCFNSNGSRKRTPCFSREYSTNGVREEFVKIADRIAALEARANNSFEIIMKQQKQIDILLGLEGIET